MKLANAATRIFAVLAVASLPAGAQNVEITPVGSHPGELCANDRATIFEDPTGVRLLYDIGHTITGTDDERLGTIHVVLLSHAHGDHIGDQKLKGLGAGTCANSERIPLGPNSNTAEVAAAKNVAARVARLDAREDAEGADASPRHQRANDGVRRQGAVRGGVLNNSSLRIT